MTTHYVSLGMQCTTATVFSILGLKAESLPFDWILTNPQFVLEMFRLLFIEKMSTTEIVKEHFLNVPTRAVVNQWAEHWIEQPEIGPGLYNKKYGVVFPHDKPDDYDKFIRRFDRLKELVLDTSNYITFVYVSHSSPTFGNYTLDGKTVICDVYKTLSKIFELIHKVRNGTRFKIVLYDAINSENMTELNSCIQRIKIEQKKNGVELPDEIKTKFVY